MNIISDVNNAKIGVVGAGSWGTALANLLGNKGFKVDFWVFEKEIKEQIEKFCENKVFLPDIVLSSNISPSNDIADVVKGKDLVLIVVPSHVMRETAIKISGLIDKNTIIVSASKGIENGTHLTMTGVLKECIKNVSEDNFAVLSGPSFAKEVAKSFPTAV
ncbi:MAG: NAD(P)-binding domain-containing protein, partial [Proteobacteria bacterium]|nr:NAD(P)-binding domain-containing protein [Pseudomonadota bacterium]